jgi:hypothetical protein
MIVGKCDTSAELTATAPYAKIAKTAVKRRE